MEYRIAPLAMPTVLVSVSNAAGSVRTGVDRQFSTDAELARSGRETCANLILIVDGRRPQQPQFSVSTPDGREVRRGKFEWG